MQHFATFGRQSVRLGLVGRTWETVKRIYKRKKGKNKNPLFETVENIGDIITTTKTRGPARPTKMRFALNVYTLALVKI